MEFNFFTMKHFIKQRKHLMESKYQSFGAAIKHGYYQEAYDMIVPTLQSLIHNDLQLILLHELFVEIGVHTHKDYFNYAS
jgi:hypothetical protein